MKPFLLLLLAASFAFAADAPAPDPQIHQHRITGLFAADREADFRRLLEEMPGIELVKLDVERGQGEFRYDAKATFRGAKPEDVWKQFNQRVANASNNTFGIQQLLPIPTEQLVKAEIPLVLLDCRGCCLGIHEALIKTEGVAQVLADQKTGIVTAYLDPAKSDREALIALLKKREV